MTLTFFKNKPLRILIILQCAVLPLQAQFYETIENMEEYNRKTLNELVFLHTDREIYYPGDTLWFKAYVRNKPSLRKSSLSRDLFVNLVNDKGEVVQDAKYLTSKAGTIGQLIFSNNLPEGVYLIVAWSSWMQNFDAEEIFKKRIEIRYETKTNFKLIPTYDKKSYFPGDTVKIKVKCYDNLRREVEDVSFIYKLSIGDETMLRGSANMYNKYSNTFHFVLPDDIQEPCKLELWGKHEDIILDKNYTIPVRFTVHLNFFPEGGQALNGRMNNIAFKAVYPKGMPASIEGEIIDEKGEILKTVASQHHGMGSFPSIPKKGKDFYLKITKPSGIAQHFKLPQGKDRGWHLSARNNQDKIYVEIQKKDLPSDTCLLTLMIRSHIFYSKVIAVDNAKTLTIPTGNLPSGVGVITLIDKDLLPRAERLVFVNYHRRNQVEMSTGSQKYLPREQVTLNIKVNGQENKPMQGSYSLAVVDQKLGLSNNIDGTNIYSEGYFLTEIKGRVGNPAYYFNTGSRQERFHLDLLLLTQGWRNYQYLDQVKNIDSLPGLVNQDVISGQILKKRNILNPKPTKGKLKVFFGGTSHTLPTDEKGHFSFRPVFDGVNPNIFLSATDDKGEDDVVIQMDPNRYKNNLMDYLTRLIDSLNQKSTSTIYTYKSIEKLYETNQLNHYWIESVTVTAKKQMDKMDPETSFIEDNFLDKRKANASILNNAYDNLDVLEQIGLHTRTDDEGYVEAYYQGNWHRIKMYVDGLEWGSGIEDGVQERNLNSIFPQEIKEFYILKGLQAQFLYESPVVCYITRKPYDALSQSNNRTNAKSLNKYTLKKEFFTPIYDTEEKKEDPSPDLRKTIHWEPEVQLDSTGRATILFYNADRYTKIKCILQGISDEGIPVYGEAGYEVSFLK